MREIKNKLFVEVRPFSFAVGQIIDITSDGMSFCYNHHGNRLKEYFEINLWNGDKCYLSGITVKNISESDVDTKKTALPNKKKKCNVHFLYPTSEQKDRLACFIRQYSENTNTTIH